jgi:ADP-ribose pyrophosphatase YjhB (NUDIX family)
MPTKQSNKAGGIVINKEGKILVVAQRHNTWSLPKGGVEEGETDLEAAKREIYEESGVKDLQFVKYLITYERYKIGLKNNDDFSELKTISLFLFLTDFDGELKPIDPDNPEARWVDRKDVSKMLTNKIDGEVFDGLCKDLPF